MNEEVREKLKQWVLGPDPPDPSEVRKTRRFLAATGENDPLTEVLMMVEKRLENDRENPLEPLRSHLEENEVLRTRIRLKISEREPFEGAREHLLRRALERFQGRIVDRSGDTIGIEVEDPAGSVYLRSLYNIEGEEIFRNKS